MGSGVIGRLADDLRAEFPDMKGFSRFNLFYMRGFVAAWPEPIVFVQRLVGPDSELAQQVAKDPYNFEFLGLSGEVAERDLESAVTSRITETLRELGPGFAFVGRQVHFDVDGDDFYVDMLFLTSGRAATWSSS